MHVNHLLLNAVGLMYIIRCSSYAYFLRSSPNRFLFTIWRSQPKAGSQYGCFKHSSRNFIEYLRFLRHGITIEIPACLCLLYPINLFRSGFKSLYLGHPRGGTENKTPRVAKGEYKSEPASRLAEIYILEVTRLWRST